MEFKPLYTSDSTLKTYQYGPFFVILEKRPVTRAWILIIRMHEHKYRNKKEVKWFGTFRATHKNVKYNIEKLIYNKKHEIVEMFFEG